MKNNNQKSDQIQTSINHSQILAAGNNSIRNQNSIGNIEIDLPTSVPLPIHKQTDNSSMQNIRDNKKMESNNQLMLENKKLRAMNKQLRKKLEEFQKRLDQNLRNQKDNQSKYKVGQEIVQSMQLRNAYKMCEIYKKQIAHLKKKGEFNKESRIDELANMVFQLEKQKDKLQAQIRDLKKMNRIQEKSIKQIVGPNVAKIIRENQQLKQSVKKNADKNVSFTALHVNLQRLSNQKKKDKDKSKDKIKDKDKGLQAYGSERLKTLGWDEQQISNSQVQAFRNKIMKDNRKISLLMSQNSKLRENLDQLRNQLIEKDKQFLQLRQKFFSLKKQSSFVKKRIQTQSVSLAKPSETSQNSKTQFRQSRHRKLKSEKIDEIRHSQISMKSQKHVKKYPKLVQAGERKQQSYKWNHHQFNSKIKQIQVCPHPLGHIKEINFRYQKGEPSRISRTKYANFCCEENQGEYITKVKGGFKDGLLRFINVQTNQGRRANFCQYQLESEIKSFEFATNGSEYLGAFFGENSNEGINRIGCLIQCEK